MNLVDTTCTMYYGQLTSWQIPAMVATVLGLVGEAISRRTRVILLARFVLTLASLTWLTTLAGIGVYFCQQQDVSKNVKHPLADHTKIGFVRLAFSSQALSLRLLTLQQFQS